MLLLLLPVTVLRLRMPPPGIMPVGGPRSRPTVSRLAATSSMMSELCGQRLELDEEIDTARAALLACCCAASSFRCTPPASTSRRRPSCRRSWGWSSAAATALMYSRRQERSESGGGATVALRRQLVGLRFASLHFGISKYLPKRGTA